MIELQWIEREVFRHEGGPLPDGMTMTLPPPVRVLQFRQFIPASTTGGRWSDWQDVPVVQEAK